MREIKFRAWDNKTKIMHIIENHGIKWISLEEVDSARQGNFYSFISGWIHGILMQYTGLKDKNGKEIYEGDVLNTPDTYDVLVLYSVENGKWYGEYLNKDNRILEPCDINDSVKFTSTVIGNIYENSELMEER